VLTGLLLILALSGSALPNSGFIGFSTSQLPPLKIQSIEPHEKMFQF